MTGLITSWQVWIPIVGLILTHRQSHNTDVIYYGKWLASTNGVVVKLSTVSLSTKAKAGKIPQQDEFYIYMKLINWKQEWVRSKLSCYFCSLILKGCYPGPGDCVTASSSGFLGQAAARLRLLRQSLTKWQRKKYLLKIVRNVIIAYQINCQFICQNIHQLYVP